MIQVSQEVLDKFWSSLKKASTLPNSNFTHHEKYREFYHYDGSVDYYLCDEQTAIENPWSIVAVVLYVCHELGWDVGCFISRDHSAYPDMELGKRPMEFQPMLMHGEDSDDRQVNGGQITMESCSFYNVYDNMIESYVGALEAVVNYKENPVFWPDKLHTATGENNG